MSFNHGSDEFSLSATINVTPLVDVMLVLLVIFMVTAPLLQQGVEVTLPKATSAPLQGTAEQVVLSIDKAGALYLGSGNRVELKDLGKKIGAIFPPIQTPPARLLGIKGISLPINHNTELVADLRDDPVPTTSPT